MSMPMWSSCQSSYLAKLRAFYIGFEFFKMVSSLFSCSILVILAMLKTNSRPPKITIPNLTL